MRSPRRLLLAVAILLGAVVFAHQDQTLPVFRSRVDLVVLDVSVLDKDRRPVHGLAADDFSVLEDGKPQKITMFSAVDLPDPEEPPARWMKDVVSDVRRNEDDANAQLVILLLDDANPMEAGDVLSAKRYARSVIDRLGPLDLCAVAFLADARSGQEFTHDRARLIAALDRFNSPDPLANGALAQMGGLMALRSLKGQAEALADLPSMRKSLIFMTTKGVALESEVLRDKLDASALAEDGGATDLAGMNAQTLGEFGDFLRAAQRANVTVYCVDPGGLRAPGMNSGGRFDPNPSPLNRTLSLQALSVVTGGFAVVNTNDPEPGITQAFRENRSYYLIAYASSNPRTDGRFRKVEIKVNRRDVLVRARNGYFEPEAKKKAAPAPAPLSAALAATVAKGDLPMQVAAAPFAVPGKPKAAVAVVLALERQAPAGVARFMNFDVSVNAYDYMAKRRATDRFHTKAALRPGSAEAASFEVLSRLDLPPGRYQLRIAAEQLPIWTSVAPGRTEPAPMSGSVFCDLDVPDFSGAPLSLSGVVLGVSPPLAFADRPELKSMLPFMPTTLRRFIRADAVSTFVRVYQGRNAAPQPVTATARIVDGNSHTVFENVQELNAKDFGAARAADLTLPLPTRTLEPGEYLLTIEAKAGTHTAQRHVRFSVR